jgi:hypothetical protein
VVTSQEALLYKLILDSRANTLDHAEGFHPLNEFHKVTTRHHTDLWDLSMKMVMDTSIIPKDIPTPFNSKHEVWNHLHHWPCALGGVSSEVQHWGEYSLPLSRRSWHPGDEIPCPAFVPPLEAR